MSNVSRDQLTTDSSGKSDMWPQEGRVSQDDCTAIHARLRRHYLQQDAVATDIPAATKSVFAPLIGPLGSVRSGIARTLGWAETVIPRTRPEHRDSPALFVSPEHQHRRP